MGIGLGGLQSMAGQLDTSALEVGGKGSSVDRFANEVSAAAGSPMQQIGSALGSAGNLLGGVMQASGKGIGVGGAISAAKFLGKS